MGRLGLVAADAAPRRVAVLRLLAPVALLAAVTIGVLVARTAFDSTPTPAPANVPAVRPAVKPPPPPPARQARKRFYLIRRGDTLGAVAARFDTTVERLLALNPGISPTALSIGAKIRIA
jgi:hypothetical protein